MGAGPPGPGQTGWPPSCRSQWAAAGRAGFGRPGSPAFSTPRSAGRRRGDRDRRAGDRDRSWWRRRWGRRQGRANWWDLGSGSGHAVCREDSEQGCGHGLGADLVVVPPPLWTAPGGWPVNQGVTGGSPVAPVPARGASPASYPDPKVPACAGPCACCILSASATI